MGLQDWRVEGGQASSDGKIDWSTVFPKAGEGHAALAAPTGAAAPAQPEARPAEDFGSMPISEVASRAVSNIPQSAGRLAGSLFDAASHPIDTLRNIGGLEAGYLAKGAQQLGYHGLDDPEAERMADALNADFARKYGSAAGFKEYVASDPVGALSDLSTLAGGAGAGAKAAGLPGIAGKAAKVSSAIDPLNMAAKVASVPLSAAGATAKAAMSHASGVPYGVLGDIENLARNAGADARAAFQSTKTGADPHVAVDAAKSALKQLAQKASDEYVATKGNLTTQQLDVTPVIQQIDDAKASLGVNAAVNYPDEVMILDELKNRVAAMKDTSAVELNHLKIGIGDVINDAVRPNKRGLFSSITDSIKDVVSKEDPTYSKMLDDWTRWRSDLRNIEDLLGKGDRRSAMSNLAALMKAMSTGKKGAALSLLETAPGGANIRPSLAGAMVNPMRASGQTLTRDLLESGALFSVLGGHPAVTLPFLLSSPRLAGNTAYALGTAKKAADAAGSVLPGPAIQSAMGRIGQLPYTQEDRAHRKSGGRVGGDHEAAADQLVRAAERAKRGQSAQTEALLNQSDDAVAQALEVANRSI